jgi:siroheme synthase-like protein
MRTHAVFLRLDGRPCVVVGSDRAAAAKVRACVEAGATVTVVAADPDAETTRLAEAGRVALRRRAYRSGDLAGAVLAYASVRAPEVVAELQAEAARERVLLNVMDAPEASAFLAPAVLQRGDLQVAVGTGGASPGLAAGLRNALAETIGPEYGPYVAVLGAVRRALAGRPDRAEVMGRLVESDLLGLVRRGDRAGVERLLAAVTGTACPLDELGVGIGGVG